ncbi:MAG: DUF554 domain-containing protein [Carbonactinosporaceae bacterium]
MTGLGTLIDAMAVLAGSTAGVALGGRIPKRWRELLMATLALFIVVIGVEQGSQVFTGPFAAAVGSAAVLVVLGVLLAGGALGSLLDIEAWLDRLGGLITSRLGWADQGSFVAGFVTATLVVCVGPLAVLGAFADGVEGDISLLVVKSLVDGCTTLAIASQLGWGVSFSVLPLLIYQGGLTALAAVLRDVMSPEVVGSMTAVGGVLLVAVGFRLFELREIAVANLLPALVLAPLCTAVVLALR